MSKTDMDAAAALLVQLLLGVEPLQITARTVLGDGLSLELGLNYSRWQLRKLGKDGSNQRFITGRAYPHRKLREMLEEALTLSGSAFRMESLTVRGNRSLAAALQEPLAALLAEVQQQALPDAPTRQANKAVWRAELAAEKLIREQSKARAAKRAENQREKLRAEHAAAPVVDAVSFLAALKSRISQHGKIDSALLMLKSGGYQLFSDIADQTMLGIIKSQTDDKLIYACSLAHDGDFSCCTQNLNVCGGLRGEVCKHLLALLIGLVNAGQIDASRVDAWLRLAIGRKPTLDKESMAEVFLRYHGAVAGDIDWRPTQTVPEDFYDW